ncbi:MAG TPA: hypothetical protein VK066_31100 [Chloroflexota bacterium]|nr:hypothetical protein [Chloroflexota bacterium]
MATTRKAVAADDLDAFQQGAAAVDAGTDCAACHAPLPEGHRYVCTACAEDSARRADAILAALQAPSADLTPIADLADVSEDDELMDCPTCGMPLDASGRCAGCVTTVRR